MSSPVSLATKIFCVFKEDLNQTFLILEGLSDYNLWNDNFSHKFDKMLRIEYSGNKDASIETLRIIYSEFSKEIEIKGVIAIIDADFDHIKKEDVFSHPCLFRTDFHDIELMMLKSEAFIKFYNRFCTERGRLKHILKTYHKKQIGDDEIPEIFLLTLLENTKKIGILRWVNYKNDFQLSFKDINHFFILSEDLFTVDSQKLLDHIITKNGRLNEFKVKFEDLINIESNENLDLFQVCQGHDAISILTIWINNLFCKREPFSQLQTEDIHKFIESAFEFRFFIKYNLYKNLKIWENNNIPYKIFI